MPIVGKLGRNLVNISRHTCSLMINETQFGVTFILSKLVALYRQSRLVGLEFSLFITPVG